MSDIKIATMIVALVSAYVGIFLYYFGPMGIFIAYIPFIVVALFDMLWVMIYQMVEEYYKGKEP